VTKHQFILHHAPKGLDRLINSCDWVLTVHGISVFETLMYGRVCVVFNPYADQNLLEMIALEESRRVSVVNDHDRMLACLAASFARQGSSAVHRHCAAKPDGQGALRLLESVVDLAPV
jgi:hypothetical protein